MATVHVIGAGLAGLAAAVRLSEAGRRVVVHESARHAGGRARSYYDEALDRRIDNGNHLILAGNYSVRRYLKTVGAADALSGPAKAAFPFLDVRSGARWTVRPNAGPLPWWVLVPARRIPGTKLGDYLSGLGILGAGPEATVADCLDAANPLYETFWEPLTLAALNTPPAEGAAAPLAAVLRETFAKGAGACRPLVAREGLSEALIDPALAWLGGRGVEVGFGRRLKAMDLDGETLSALRFGSETIELGADDRVVLAVPPPRAAELLPGLEVPGAAYPIVNVHYRLEAMPASAEALFGDGPFAGLIGGAVHWLFRRGDIVSVTVSAARDLAEKPNDEIARLCWREAALALNGGAGGSNAVNPDVPPRYRVINERRATFAQTPEAIRLRPGPRSKWQRLYLAGDWTDTGVPATIEGAVRSGYKAAEAILGD